MKEIKLTNKDLICLVDDEDYLYLCQWKWRAQKHKSNNTFYVARSFDGRSMHRMILDLSKGDIAIDHKNGNGLDNRRCNLRKANGFQNAANRSSYKNSTSKYKGVCWDKEQSKWLAQIQYKDINIKIGRFALETEAALAYNIQAKKFHGEFAKLNVIT